jgi:pyrimidine-specific ribonucleoside hydrolase
MGETTMAGSARREEKSSLLTFKNGFPLEEGVFVEEIQTLLSRGIIERYGREEFERIILTHEFHGHLGVYTLIGTKMGIFALETLGAPRNSVQVMSECWGGDFPVRCVNDGLVVAIGCSPARGNIEIDRTLCNCAARFIYRHKTLRLQLKKDYQDALEDRISEAVKKYKVNNVLTAPYWEEVVNFTWWVWEEWDRKVVFSVALEES